MVDHAHTDKQRLTTPQHFQPAGERLITLDALRGFAILGILLPNIFAFAWPTAAMTDPSVIGGSQWNVFAHDLNSTAFLGKFMFNFAMLFGAGVVLFDRKTTPTDRKPKLSDGWALWYRRCAALLVIGMVHAYLFWFGDILFWYAVCGLSLVWWARKLSAQTQIVGGLALFTLGAAMMVGLTGGLAWAVGEGHIPASQMNPDPARELAGYLGSWFDAFKIRAITTLAMHLMFLPLMLPTILGIMILGMGLTKSGVLTGERSTRFHATLCITMLVLGTATTTAGYVLVKNTEFSIPSGAVWQSMAQFLGAPLAIGYSQLIVLACRAKSLRKPVQALANVGRMALTNYLSQTLICTTLFYGYGFGFFASIPFPHLFGVIVAVWVFNFALSALWLRYFRFGPFEWLWRQMTYLGLPKA